MAHKMLEQCQIGNHAQNPNQSVGPDKQDDNKDNETKDVVEENKVQSMENQDESIEEVVVNGNNKNKHTIQHNNEHGEVLVENNDNKNKDIDVPNLKELDVINNCKGNEYIQHYNDEYKDGTNHKYEK